MTRFKRYLRSKGEKLECDYPFMPYNLGSVPTLEAVIVNPDQLSISYVHVVGTLTKTYDRSGRCIIDFD